MLAHNKTLVIGVAAVIVLAVIGAGVHLVPWLRDNRTEISLLLLMLLLVGSGFTVTVGLLTTFFADPAPDNTEPDNAAPAQRVCPGCGEPVRPEVLVDLVPAYRQKIPVPQWRHLDGTPLCPDIGPNGHRPTEPINSRTSLSEHP